jgi:hypothetical protein
VDGGRNAKSGLRRVIIAVRRKKRETGLENDGLSI